MAQPILLAQDNKPEWKSGQNYHLELVPHNPLELGNKLVLKLAVAWWLVLGSILASLCVHKPLALKCLLLLVPDSTLASLYVRKPLASR